MHHPIHSQWSHVDLNNSWKLGEWTLSIRAIRPDDETLWLELIKDMSWATRYKRGARHLEDLTTEDAQRAVSPGSALVPGSLAIISACFDESRRGRAIGTW